MLDFKIFRLSILTIIVKTKLTLIDGTFTLDYHENFLFGPLLCMLMRKTFFTDKLIQALSLLVPSCDALLFVSISGKLFSEKALMA